MQSGRDWVEYGGYTIRRALAEEVEERVRGRVVQQETYYTLLEMVRSGLVDFMAPFMKSPYEGSVLTVGGFLQDVGIESGPHFDADVMRRTEVEEELAFGEAVGWVKKAMAEEGLRRGLNKEERGELTVGEAFNLEEG